MKTNISRNDSVNEKRPTCIILGLASTALGPIRSLGRKGIKVYGFDAVKNNIGSFSRYCDFILCPDPKHEESNLLTFLKKFRASLYTDAFILPTNDNFVLFLSRNRQYLKDFYKFLLPNKTLVEQLNDKRKFYKLAISHNINAPKTSIPRTLDDLYTWGRQFGFPCILKPAYGHLFDKVKEKGIIANSMDELLEAWNKLSTLDGQVILQEFVKGDDALQYSLSAYLDCDSNPLAVFSAKKIRQNPPGAGVGSLVESYKEKDVENLGLSFLKDVGFKGIAEVEFKRDCNSQKIYIIEVNTRIWGQNSLAIKCGVDIPFIAFCDAYGYNREKRCITSGEKKVKWIDFRSDFFACFGSDGYMKRGKLTVINWLKSFRGKKDYAIFCFDDILPFIRSTKLFLLILLARSLKRLKIK